MRTLLFVASTVLFALLVVSWIASFAYPLGVTVFGFRRYAIVCDGGVIQFRRSVKTDIVQYGWNAWSVEEVGFAPADAPLKVMWWRPIPPHLAFSPWRIYSEGEVLLGGGYVPEPSTGRTTAMGELTRATAVAYWPIALVLSVPAGWMSLGLRQRVISRRRRAAGMCARCGYDLRGTPQRCPECGLTTDGRGTIFDSTKEPHMPSLRVPAVALFALMLAAFAAAATTIGCRREPLGARTSSAGSSSTATTQPSRPILGLQPGWELAPRATYSAAQTATQAIIKARGENPTAGYEVKLVQSPLRISPPQWMLARKPPDGAVAQMITPFEATGSFETNQRVKKVVVTDASGRHEVEVERARE